MSYEDKKQNLLIPGRSTKHYSTINFNDDELSQSSAEMDVSICSKLDGSSRFDTLSSATLTWKDVFVCSETHIRGNLFSKNTDKYKYRNILKGVSGVAEPGQFVAIMGASGAGKTTLLNTLARRQKAKVTGSIRVNGWPIKRYQMSLISGYVKQHEQDSFMATLTVKETMMFYAMLRMDKRLTAQKKCEKVNAILENLGLIKCQDFIIGNSLLGLKEISGGERKRLSVAVELLGDPPLLFLDEPTSGLDSFMAESIVRLVSNLAKANKTILMTIHQPSSEVFALFDKICLVADGNIVFLGDSHQAIQHFEDFGKPCPDRYNPADHFITELAVIPGIESECLTKIEGFTTHYKESKVYLAMEVQINEVSSVNTVKPNIISRSSLQTSLWTQFNENVKRAFIVAKRTPRLTKQRIVETFVWSALCGLAFFMVPNDQDASQNKGGLLFFMAVSTFSFAFAQAAVIPLDFPIVHKEYRAGMYGVGTYILSVIILMIPSLVALPLLQLTLSYFLTGLKRSPGPFFSAYIILVGVSWASSCLGLFASSIGGSVGTASAIVSPVMMSLTLFGGLYQNDRLTPYWFYPIKYMSWIRYGWYSLMVNEFTDLSIECPGVSPVECIYVDGNQILEIYGIDPDSMWFPNLALNFGIGFGLVFVSWLCLWRRVQRK